MKPAPCDPQPQVLTPKPRFTQVHKKEVDGAAPAVVDPSVDDDEFSPERERELVAAATAQLARIAQEAAECELPEIVGRINPDAMRQGGWAWGPGAGN